MKKYEYAISGVWWSVLVEIAAAIHSAENCIKRQWLLDALEIGCVTAHPSTVIIQDVMLEFLDGCYSFMLLPRKHKLAKVFLFIYFRCYALLACYAIAAASICRFSLLIREMY